MHGITVFRIEDSIESFWYPEGNVVPTYFHSSERKRVYTVWTILKAIWSKVFWLLWTWRVYSVMAIFRMIVFKKHWKRSNYAINIVCAIFEMNTVVRKTVKRGLWDWRKATEIRAQEETERQVKCVIYTCKCETITFNYQGYSVSYFCGQCFQFWQSKMFCMNGVILHVLQ